MSERDRDYYWEQVKQQNRQKPPDDPKRNWRILVKPLLWFLIPLLILAAGTALWRNPASQPWLHERWVLLQIRLGISPDGMPAAPAASPYSDSPRKLSECIKPGNVIDDEVRACVKGYRPKTW
ncbi:hypothetical protein ACYCAX_11150 [Pseudomonas sp. MT3]|uniref:hypothetical protein n=1 Tax=Pseudomonas sp. ATCC 13867 TaxID=1294143 RepID=UPI0002C4DDFD|nr:hypothetical protein [Pseudomonas sp. ATCC 13867]AGI25273.1 hypothetical protein H681_17025 [Pseudomonas sp. ATCC 13867]RFQ26793.1 hypothetical protein D0N87_19230 [Pseudomonas sp. ATCC 13867]